MCHVHSEVIGWQNNFKNVRTIIMGLKFKADTFYEFDIDDNGVDEIYQEKGCMSNFSTAVYKDSHLILTGGVQTNTNQAINQAVEYSFKVNERTGKLILDQRCVLP
jgi:hypothetical protein